MLQDFVSLLDVLVTLCSAFCVYHVDEYEF